jgi:ornithine cyclodeaminase/alanine dehydrogenase-like protein (mu-crystallin family)
LGAILAGRVAAPAGATVFESHGLALWDVAAAATVVARAEAEGAGERVDLF